MSNFLNNMWRKLVFFVGDIRLTGAFPGIGVGKREHIIDFAEILEVLHLVQYGDVGLHQDWGYLSNMAIPGFMKHAWIHTNDGVMNPMIVEATSEGVIKRSPIYPLYSDYAIILRPNDMTEEERKGACMKANNIVGVKYDVDFQFDIEAELKFNEDKREASRKDLEDSQKNLQNYDQAFSCTEVCSYAWWHKQEELRLYRKERRGKNVILGDDFMNHGWSIVWMSSSITVDVAHKKGMHEEGVSMIESYLK